MKINSKKPVQDKPRLSKAMKKKKLAKTVEKNSTSDSAEEGQNYIPIDKDSGVVYFGRIPHGFYEQEMRKYFSQFGKVLRTRVVRSSKTGRSKGFGYVEFADADVAKIVSETMNNYLMGNRLIKSVVVPNTKNYFGGQSWNKKKYPSLLFRREQVKNKNKRVSHDKEVKLVQKKIDRLNKIKERLEQKGFTWDLGITPSTTNPSKKVIEVVSENSEGDLSEENASSNEDLDEQEVDSNESSDEAIEDDISSEEEYESDMPEDESDGEEDPKLQKNHKQAQKIAKTDFSKLRQRQAGGAISKKKIIKQKLKTNLAFTKAAKDIINLKDPELKSKSQFMKKHK